MRMTVEAVTESQPISVAVVDDHPVVLHGLETLIQREPDMAVVASARSGEEAVRRVLATRPDVVVMDIRMPGGDGVEATRRILAAHPATHVILLSGEEGAPVIEGLRAGALSFLSKTSIGDRLVDSIRYAANGRPVLSSDQLGNVLQALREPSEAVPLTHREHEILTLVADGRTNEQISRAIGASLSTVKNQLALLFEKLGAEDRASAVAISFRRGWLR
jgi:DNA-binding NarL/FixJ family response regulator